MYDLSVGDEGMLDPFSGRTGGWRRFELLVGRDDVPSTGGGLGIMV